MRYTLNKKLRFSVFARDNFTCQYCGRRPDEDAVVLHADHTVSVKDGGTNDIENLVTSCADCNLGKGAKSILKRTKTIEDVETELSMAKERLEQVKAMNKKRNAIDKINSKIFLQKVKWATDIIGDSDERLLELLQNAADKLKCGQDKLVEALHITASRNETSPFSDNHGYVSYFSGVCRNLSLSKEQQGVLMDYHNNIFSYTRMYPSVRKLIVETTRDYGFIFHEEVIETLKKIMQENHGQTYKTRDEVLPYVNSENYTVYKSGHNLQVLVCDTIFMLLEDYKVY